MRIHSTNKEKEKETKCKSKFTPKNQNMSATEKSPRSSANDFPYSD